MTKEERTIETLKNKLYRLETKNKSILETNSRLQRELNRLKQEFAPKALCTDSLTEIVKSVANKYYKTNIEMQCRNSEVVLGRMFYYAWLRKYTDLSLKSIARTLNVMAHHSTLLHSLRKHDDYLDFDKQYQREWANFCSEIELVRNRIVNEENVVVNAS